MSESVSEEEDFKLPLRPWLKNHIEKKTFPGLDWLDQEQLIFKIPWTKKNHPGWEKDYEVFKAWAKHRGRFSDEDPVDYNKLKGNFRSVLHKSEDFLELKQESKTEQQTGNYRVFQILPSSKVKANRKRSRSKSQEVPQRSPVVSKQKRSSLVPATSTPLPQSSQEPINIPADQQQIEFHDYSGEDIFRELVKENGFCCCIPSVVRFKTFNDRFLTNSSGPDACKYRIMMYEGMYKPVCNDLFAKLAQRD